MGKLSQLLLLSKEVREVNKCANYRPLLIRVTMGTWEYETIRIHVYV